MSEHRRMQGPHGQTLENGFPKTIGPTPLRRPLRAFITAVYLSQATNTGNASSLTQAQGARGVYVDVYVYGALDLTGPRKRVLYPMPVGLHEGDVRLPRPAARAVNGAQVASFEQGLITPEEIDADHVLIDFIDGNPALPYVDKILPHPRIDFGNESLPLGVRLLPLPEEGEPRLIRHRGISVMITDAGNVVIDTTRAHGPGRQEQGQELAPDASAGQIDVSVMPGRAVRILHGTDPLLLLQGGAAEAALTLGSGERHPAQVEELRALYTELASRVSAMAAALNATNAALALHDHPGIPPGPPGLGPSPALLQLSTTLQGAPAWDQAIENDRVAFPNRTG